MKVVNERGLDAGRMRIGIIGAGGNIGAALTQLLTDDFPQFRLVGRKETLVRVERAAEAAYEAALARMRAGGPMLAHSLGAALAQTPASSAASGLDVRRILRAEFGEDPFLPVCTDIESLEDCTVIVSASNAITPILNSRNLGKRVRIILDLSVPSDVDGELIKARPDVDVIRGGIALAPAGNDFEVDLLKLPHNCLLACMAETAVIGLAGGCNFTSTGNIDPESVRQCQILAEGLGFGLGYAAVEKSFSVELE
jgi:predicted amino acid dehydrogenase